MPDSKFLALDRIDLQFEAKDCARKMARPTTIHWQRLKRVGRYLRGCPRGVISYPFHDEPEFLTAMSDANWALEIVIALSSAESELFALVKSVSGLLGIRSALKDWGGDVRGVVKTDASAALGIIQRVWAKSDTLTLRYCVSRTESCHFVFGSSCCQGNTSTHQPCTVTFVASRERKEREKEQRDRRGRKEGEERDGARSLLFLVLSVVYGVDTM